MEIQGNIRVFCRVKPNFERDDSEVVVSYPEESQIKISIDRDNGRKSKLKVFEFDKVFDPSSSQENIYEGVEPLITSLVDGTNVCIFACKIDKFNFNISKLKHSRKNLSM